MTPDRLDDLLERALETGAVPADATDGDRAEVERMLTVAGGLKLNATRVSGEANGVMPTARARFQRHMQEQHTPERVPVSAPHLERGFLGRFFSGRMLTMGSSVAAMAVVAVVAVLVLQPFNEVETAAALTVDDYVQIEGVVSASEGGVVTVQSSEIGNLQIALSDLTSVTDGNGVRGITSLKPGDPVLVSGVVTAKRSIAASNVAVAENQTVPTPSAKAKPPILKSFRPGLQGSIRLITLSPDGKRAQVLLVMAEESLLVDVDPKSMDQFLAGSPQAVGVLVKVVEAPDLRKGVFRLQPVEQPTASPTPRTNPAGTPPQFQNVKGLVVGRALNVLMVRTESGTIPVVLKGTTSIRFGSSGLTPDDVRNGETVIGYEVAVTGNPEEPNGRRVVATLIVIIGKPSPAPAR